MCAPRALSQGARRLLATLGVEVGALLGLGLGLFAQEFLGRLVRLDRFADTEFRPGLVSLRVRHDHGDATRGPTRPGSMQEVGEPLSGP